MYYLTPIYDKILHFFVPIIGAITIFYVVNKLKISFKWKLLITFVLVFSISAIHEILEYILDLIWDFKLQGVWLRDITGLEKLHIIQEPLDDTMIDMVWGLIGSIVFVIGKTITNSYNRRYKKLRKIKN